MDVIADALGFVSLEITGKCQLGCVHCYADSGPRGTHGTMAGEDWRRILDEATALGVRRVQFIGGEPFLRRELPGLVERALASGMEVEVYTNLAYRMPQMMWSLLSRSGIQIATSYYSSDANEHDAITGRQGSHDRTLANIKTALDRAIPMRVGVIHIHERQRSRDAISELRELGVKRVELDWLRRIGCGNRPGVDAVDQLCGQCGDRKVAVSPTGEVWPCVMARWIRLGSIHQMDLGEIYERSRSTRVELQETLSELPLHPVYEKDGDGGCTVPVCCIPPHLR